MEQLFIDTLTEPARQQKDLEVTVSSARQRERRGKNVHISLQFSDSIYYNNNNYYNTYRNLLKETNKSQRREVCYR